MIELIQANYPDFELPLAQAQLVLFMLGMGATLTLTDFLLVMRQPRGFFLGLIGVFGVTLLVALGFGKLPGLHQGTVLGLVLLAALPGGTLSNVFTFLSRGNVALSISMSACGTLAALGTVPLMLHTFGTEHVPIGFKMPTAEILREIILCLLIPLSLGLLIGRYAIRFRERFSKICVRLGFVLVAAMIVGSLASGRIEFSRYSFWEPFWLVVFILVIQQVSMLPARLMLHPRDTVAIGMEVTIRNVFLGLLVYSKLTAAGLDSEVGKDVLFVLLMFGGTSLAVAAPMLLRYRRVIRRL